MSASVGIRHGSTGRRGMPKDVIGAEEINWVVIVASVGVAIRVGLRVTRVLISEIECIRICAVRMRPGVRA